MRSVAAAASARRDEVGVPRRARRRALRDREDAVAVAVVAIALPQHLDRAEARVAQEIHQLGQRPQAPRVGEDALAPLLAGALEVQVRSRGG